MRFASLQILRFIAALAVVVHHLLMHFDTDMHVPALHWKGDFGVDIFFVISGFIISLATLRTHDPMRFMAKRFARILPNYWTFTLCVFLVGLVAPGLLSHPSTNPLDLLRSLLFVPYPNPAGLYQPILFVGWTLNYEMFFYVVYALFMAAFRQRWIFIPALIIAFMLLASLHFAAPPANGALAFYTSGLILEFSAGIVLHHFFHRRDYRPLPYGAALLPIGLVVSAALDQIPLTDSRAFVLGIPALLTVAGALSWQPRSTRLVTLLVLGGDASYAMYLTHPFIVNGFTKAAMHTIGNGPLALAGTGIAAIALSVVAGLVVYLGFERPAHNWVSLNKRHKSLVGLTMVNAQEPSPPEPVAETTADSPAG
jgi:exopolysaccharide production protein ExoZ